MRPIVAIAFVLALACAGCTYTVAGPEPAVVPPALPSFRPRIEYATGEFTFALNEREPKSSPFDGHRLSREIVAAWAARPFIREARLVAAGPFTGRADYNLTLSGRMHGETSFGWQLLNALTLMLSPYSVRQSYALHAVLEDTHEGTRYEASVEAADTTWVEILLVLALPWAENGHRETMRRVGDDLYEQFRRQGAFDRQAGAPVVRPRW